MSARSAAGPGPDNKFGFAVALAAAVLLAGSPSQAWLPETHRIANAVANKNRESGRAHTLRLEVELRFEGDPEAAATGVLWSDPGGSARLELVSPKGFIERHLVRGRRTDASRDGQLLESARSFLPPYFLLQATSAGALTNRLLELGVRTGEATLGYEGEHDCYVIGGRTANSSAATSRPATRDAATSTPALWVDSDAFSVVRFDSAEGASFLFGPPLEVDGLTVPAWIEVHAAGEAVARLAVLGAGSATVAPEGFAIGWLRRGPAAAGQMP